MDKHVGEAGFVDLLTEGLGGPRTAEFLGQVQAAVPWGKLVGLVAPMFARANPQAGGASRWPVELMLRCVLLQKWFNLSDPQLEEQLRDRLSFRRFVGLSLQDATPDETTFCLFRQALREHDLEAKLLALSVEHLEAQGLMLREGTLVDATIIQAPRPRKLGNGQQRGGDAEGSYIKKHGQIHYGYRAHTASDPHGLIRRIDLDTAKVSELAHFEELTATEKYLVLADSGYMDRGRAARLLGRGVAAGVLEHRVRGQKELSCWQRLWNRSIAPLRALVELPFAHLKTLGLRRTRYRGLRRNQGDVWLTALAYNFKRSLSIHPLPPLDLLAGLT